MAERAEPSARNRCTAPAAGRVKGGDQRAPSAAALEAACCRCYPASLREHYLFGSGYAGLGGDTAESRAREFLEEPHFLSSHKPRSAFHNELLRALDEVLGPQEPRDHFRRVVYTNLVKCSLAEGRKSAPFETQTTCYRRHLQREIEYFKPLAIIAIGVAKDASPTTFFTHNPPVRSTGESIPWFPLIHPGSRRYGQHYEERRAAQVEVIKRWYENVAGDHEKAAGHQGAKVSNPNIEPEKRTPALAHHPTPASGRPHQNITDTTRIVVASRFRRESAESCLAAVRAARVKCLTAGQELVQAHYDLTRRTGTNPTVADLIATARRRYTPPRSEEDPLKFWRDYLRTNIFRGIFVTE